MPTRPWPPGLVVIGSRLGLHAALAKGPLTAAELADCTATRGVLGRWVGPVADGRDDGGPATG